MQPEEVLGHILKEALDKLSIEYKVDHQVKKLHGQTMFQLLLFLMSNIKNDSWQVMAEFYQFRTRQGRIIMFYMPYQEHR